MIFPFFGELHEIYSILGIVCIYIGAVNMNALTSLLHNVKQFGAWVELLP